MGADNLDNLACPDCDATSEFIVTCHRPVTEDILFITKAGVEYSQERPETEWGSEPAALLECANCGWDIGCHTDDPKDLVASLTDPAATEAAATQRMLNHWRRLRELSDDSER